VNARPSRSRRLAALGVAVALLAGCTGDADPAPEDDETPEAATDGPTDDAGDEPTPSGRLQLTGWQESHPVLITVALRAVEVDTDGHVLVDFEAINRGIRSGGASIGQSGVLLRDDLGNVYPFVRSEEHERLRFNADERMSGTLAFTGPIDPEARRITVAFNQLEQDVELVAAADDVLSQFPKFLFEDVPLPGVGLEVDADRGGSGDSLATDQRLEVGVTVTPDLNPDLEVTVVAYATDGLTVRLELEAVNRSNEVVVLTRADPVLRDDRDSRYVFERAETADRDEENLRLEPGEEVSATLAWRGVIPADAGSLVARFNSENFENPSAPHFVVDLPLPDPS
jgi:hypothetical protein